MKEQTLIEMKNKIETLGLINQKLISELNQTATIALGVLETIKQMPDYDEAIERVKEQAAKQTSAAEAIDSLEEVSD
tara:strand:+ start:636 stop:866 length:231 start_codon:yes stop_codon:yes gene_type:complete